VGQSSGSQDRQSAAGSQDPPEQRSRLELASVEETASILAELQVAPSLASLNIFRALARFPRIARLITEPTAPLMTRGILDPRLRELVILRIAWLNRCEYEWVQHYKIARTLGADSEFIEAARRGPAVASSAAERAVLELADCLSGHSQVSDEAYARWRDALGDDEQLLEAAAVAGAWTLVAYILKVGAIPLEEGQQRWPPDGTEPADPL
jgi:AhpD family alkylhydroperoxidase